MGGRVFVISDGSLFDPRIRTWHGGYKREIVSLNFGIPEIMQRLSAILLLFCGILAFACATSDYSHYPFDADVMLNYDSNGGLGVPKETALIVSKDSNDRTSAVIAFTTSSISPNEYFFKGNIEVIVLSSTSNNNRVRVGVVPLGSFNVEEDTYDTLDRLTEEDFSQTLSNESGNKIVLDVTDALDAGVRAFELRIIGGGASSEVVLGVPTLQLTYPAWRPDPVESGCGMVYTQVPGIASPGIASRECPGYGLVEINDLFINGAPSTDGMWDDIAPYIQEYANVIMVNPPGNGKSGKITGDLTTHRWGDLVIDALAEWVRIRNFTNLHITGQDYGGPMAADLAHHIAPEGRVAHLHLVEAVSTDQILCPGDGVDGCFTDGTPSDGNPFIPACFGRNELGCADYILGYKWFANVSLVSDPQVYSYAAQLGGSPVLIAYPYPCLDSVYEILSTSCRSSTHPDFYDEHYCNGQDCGTSPATQAMKYWPQCLYTHGEVPGFHNTWTRDFNLRIRKSLKSDNLSTIPATIHCADYIDFKTIVQCRESHAEWAEEYYPNVRVNRFGGNIGHFIGEDGFNGAYSFSRSKKDAVLAIEA